MNLDVSYIPPTSVLDIYDTVEKYFDKSALWSRGRASANDILGFILKSHMQLWLVYDAETYRSYGFVITEIRQYPQCKMLVIQYCSGESNHMKHVEEKMYAVLDEFARVSNCAGIEFYGRPGWEPHVKKYGYTGKAVVYEKFFNEVQP